MRVLLRFEKGNEVKYISHLDMQRLFQRALRRAKLPCAYSQGFNPHLLISFAAALPVGVCSDAEFVEFQLTKFIHPLEVMKRLNEVMPKGVKILNAIEPEESFPNVGSVIALAEYAFTTKNGDDYSKALKDILAQEEITIEKKAKKGFALVNVRPMIHRLTQNGEVIKATLSCSNSENLRADKMAEILSCNGISVASIKRTSILICIDGFIKEPLGVNK
ncbi:MAG: TIGR03936 family radical SAM-associated protein [Clostridia bacterium]|nr:TIGR03936 family radical SAM-associated protein [Clostridia bacterium]